MSKVVFNYWPSLLLSMVLLFGIISCLKRLDFLVSEDIRALISILFGFASSCLVLSFIWIVQSKPLASSEQNAAITVGRDVPSMHPRGRANSTNSYDSNQVVITTVSNSELDVPPKYEDALVNSKPIHWYYPKEYSTIANIDAIPGARGALVCCGCSRDKSTAGHRDGSDGSSCVYCATNKKLVPDGYSRVHSKFDANQSRDGERAQPSTGASQNERYEANRNDLRKTSYVQLDVSQLIISTSPPKYHEFYWNVADSNQSTSN